MRSVWGKPHKLQFTFEQPDCLSVQVLLRGYCLFRDPGGIFPFQAKEDDSFQPVHLVDPYRAFRMRHLLFLFWALYQRIDQPERCLYLHRSLSSEPAA